MSAPAVTVALVAALLVVAVPAVWQVLRLAVTLVHELGHAMVGLAVGRRFTGFVLRGDMSGHTVTGGPTRGPGRVLSTWAGYPAPAVVGAALVWTAGRGWAAPAGGGATTRCRPRSSWGPGSSCWWAPGGTSAPSCGRATARATPRSSPP